MSLGRSVMHTARPIGIPSAEIGRTVSSLSLLRTSLEQEILPLIEDRRQTDRVTINATNWFAFLAVIKPRT